MPAKLVRDRIPEIMRSAGLTPHTRIVPQEDRLLWLLAKLREEAAEVTADPCLEECADVLEVVLAIANELGFTEAQLREEAIRKAEERGRFNSGLLLESGEEIKK